MILRRRPAVLPVFVALFGASLPVNMGDEECDAVSLLQTSRVASPKRRSAGGDGSDSKNTCLRFMHIPKNAGTSITSMNLNVPKDARPWDEFAVPVYEAEANAINTALETGNVNAGIAKLVADGDLGTHVLPGQVFDWLHEDKPESFSGSQPIYYALHAFTLGNKMPHFREISEPDGRVCQDLHTPPGIDDTVDAFFSDDSCTSWCVVREPLDRAMSIFTFWKFEECSGEGFSTWVVEKLQLELEKPNYNHGCHMVPQTSYVYGVGDTWPREFSPQDRDHQYCDRVLRLENLDEDFAKLMKEFGHDGLTLPHKFDSSTHCEIDKNDVSQEAKLIIYRLFKADYDAFGYPPPEQ